MCTRGSSRIETRMVMACDLMPGDYVVIGSQGSMVDEITPICFDDPDWPHAFDIHMSSGKTIRVEHHEAMEVFDFD